MTKLLDITRPGLLSLLFGVTVIGTGQENSNVYLYQYSHIAQSLKALDLGVEPYEVAWHLSALPDTPTASDSVVPEHRSSVTPGLPTNFEQLLWKDITPTSVLSVSQSIAFQKQRFLYPKYVYDKILYLDALRNSYLAYPISVEEMGTTLSILPMIRLPMLSRTKSVTAEQQLVYLVEQTRQPKSIEPGHLNSIRLTYNLVIFKTIQRGGVLYEIRPDDSEGSRVTCIANCSPREPVNEAYLKNLGMIDTHRRLIYTHFKHLDYSQIVQYFQQQHGVVIEDRTASFVAARQARS